jgi:hypothetical protein
MLENAVNDNVLLAIIDKIPIWFLCLVIGIYIIHKFCDKNVKMVMRIILKQKTREDKKDREQDNRLTLLETEQRILINDVKDIKKDVNSILEVLTK